MTIFKTPKYNTVLVTGGSGFLGKRLSIIRPDWHYIGSDVCNLTSQNETRELLEHVQPDAIVHLAAYVGGIKRNATQQVEFYENNTAINFNVISCARKAGIKRVLSALSTCAFPDIVTKYPYQSSALHAGPPAETNFTYGYTKRCLHVHSMACKKQLGYAYDTFVPSNLFGPQDNFDPDTSHFIPALLRKIYGSNDGDIIEMWGTGQPLRQHLYVDDLAMLIPMLLERYTSDEPIIVAPPDNWSIKDACLIASHILKSPRKFRFNGKLDGQFRKDGSCEKLFELFPDFSFTSLEAGLEKTYDWYVNEGKNK